MTKGQQLARSFMMYRNPLNDLLEQVPSDKGDFAAWDGGMSFQRLTDHLAGSSERIAAMIAGQTPGKPEPSSNFVAARARLKAGTSATHDLIAGLNDEQLSSVIEAFGGQKMPVVALVEFLIGHETHHKGQIWMMARMIGLQPPMFIKMD